MFPNSQIENEVPHWSIVRIPFRLLAIVTVSLPFFSFIFIICWSMLIDFRGVTSTHCDVDNYLPSISAAMTNPVSSFVWKISIIVHAPPRYLVTYMYYYYLKSIIAKPNRKLVITACALNALENLGLVGLTLFDSRGDGGNYEVHRNCFIMFLFCSEVYMVLLCYLLYACTIKNSLSGLEMKSLRMKTRLWITNIVSLCGTMYTFQRHNSECETGMYTLFAFFEYIVVLSNMGYHMTAYWDFYNKIFTIDLFNVRKGSYSSNFMI